MAVNWGMAADLPNQMLQSFYDGRGLRNTIARGQAMKQISEGDEEGGRNKMLRYGMTDELRAMDEHNIRLAQEKRTAKRQPLIDEQLQAQTDSMRLNQEATRQNMDIKANEEQLQFVLNTTGMLGNVLKEDGPEAAMEAFDMIAPTLKARGADDEQLQRLRQGMMQNPEQFISSLTTETEKKLYQMRDALVDEEGEIIYQSPQQAPAQGRLLSQEEAVAAGFQPGTVVQEREGQYRVVQQPARPTGGSRGASSARSGGGSDPAEIPRISAQDAKAINDYRTKADEANNMQSLIDEFVTLNEDTSTGGFGGLAGVSDVRAMFDPKLRRMKQIQDQLTPAMRNGLPGAASDRDVAMFRSATVGVDKRGEANNATAAAFEAARRRINDQAEFIEEYARRNGSLLGHREMWRDYADNNHVFYKDERGWLQAHQPDDWREWMGWDGSAPSAQAPGSRPEQSAGNDQGAVEYEWTPDGGLKRATD